MRVLLLLLVSSALWDTTSVAHLALQAHPVSTRHSVLSIIVSIIIYYSL